MHYSKLFNARRLAALVLVCALSLAASSAWAVISINISSPANGANVTAGTRVFYSVSVSGAVVGLNQVSLTGGDNFTDNNSYPASPPTNSATYNNPLIHYVDIPINASGNFLFLTVIASGYADDPVVATRNVNVTPGTPDTTAPTFTGIQTAVRLAGNTTADLTWNQATDDRTSAANMRYDIYYDTVQANVFSAGVKSTVTGALSTQLSGLGFFTVYYVGVRAKDEANNSNTNTVTIQLNPLPNAADQSWMLYQ